MVQKSEAFHIQQLQNALAKRKQAGTRSSLRGLADDLGMSAAALSRLLTGKKGISQKRAVEIAKKLHLSSRESKMFLLSVSAHHARSPLERARSTRELESIMKRLSQKSLLPLEGPSGHLSWEHMAVLELFEIGGHTATESWLAKKLGCPVPRIQQLIKDLLVLKIISIEGNGYRANSEESETTFDIPSPSLKNFHSKMLERAQLSLFQDEVAKREFLSMVFTFPSGQFKEAREAIREFQDSFARRFGSSAEQKDSVYQLSIQLFRLDKELP
ncbi:MAG: TIGR02147 family protein [Bdellovibrionaceae bacterium]|nr:TIGR02147 family protein [Pseudobdellovibrionaceae bacterium]